MKLTNPMSGVERCPQCNVAQPMLLMESAFFVEKRQTVWVMYRCRSCEDGVLAKGYLATYNSAYALTVVIANASLEVVQLIPEASTVNSDTPDRARRYLSQAIDSRASPDGAIMLAAASVDAMLKLKGYTEGSLYSRINSAKDAGLLTVEMSEWAHEVRLGSNRPRHADEEDPHITAEDVDVSIDFVKALGQFLFVLPARIARGRQAVGSEG